MYAVTSVFSTIGSWLGYPVVENSDSDNHSSEEDWVVLKKRHVTPHAENGEPVMYKDAMKGSGQPAPVAEQDPKVDSTHKTPSSLHTPANTKKQSKAPRSEDTRLNSSHIPLSRMPSSA
eukprot:TRINITY_DN5247_c0_g1_i1.p2 TRINITY_DN5247_c0_g1~~TRINITY_DN5247_c0_g1_i1.p2  ORF type:complete len:119 (+),score=18.95 TRINITY_DN5247_c0_g1_i1:103-459(+)